MKLGVMTVLLGDMSLDKALAYLKSLGVQQVEIGCGEPRARPTPTRENL